MLSSAPPPTAPAPNRIEKNNMTTIISGTNRRDSRTHQFAKIYEEFFREAGADDVHLYSLADLPDDILHVDMYGPKGQSPELARVQNELILPADRLFFLLPEYNGGMPGILKLFIDALSIREYKRTFRKKVAMAGTATGRAGNLRGMDHLTGVLLHMGATVYPNRLPISQMATLHDADGVLNADADAAMRAQVEGFLRF